MRAQAEQYAPDDGGQLAEERRLLCSLNVYDASNYDLPGRFWYVEANLKF